MDCEFCNQQYRFMSRTSRQSCEPSNLPGFISRLYGGNEPNSYSRIFRKLASILT